MAVQRVPESTGGLRPLRPLVLVLALLAAAGQSVPDHHTVLGLTGDATALQIHLAYVNLTNSFEPRRVVEPEARQRLLDIQLAFEALGDPAGKEEALSTINYWEHVRHLDDDEEFRRFTEFQSNGSAHLRIIFVHRQRSQRHWGVFAAAVRLAGRARVAQICSDDTEGGAFMASFRLRTYPAAIIFDPVSRGWRAAYSLDGVGEDAHKLLEGWLSPGDRVARVQELDADAHAQRCGGGGGLPHCAWTLVWASSAALEQQRDALLSAVKPFVDACQKLQADRQVYSATAACFWLRLGRAAGWQDLVRKHAAAAAEDPLVLAFRRDAGDLIVAPPGKSGQGAEELAAWLREVISGRAQAETAELPPLPRAFNPSEEPAEEMKDLLWRKFRRQAKVLQAQLEVLVAKAEGAYAKMDTEEKTMLAGGVLCGLMLAGLICRYCCCCCCCRRTGRLSEEEAVQQLLPVVVVPLRRASGEKLGMGIAPNSQGGFTITSISEGTLLDRWNLAQPCAALHIRKGDRIVSVTRYPAGGGGQGVLATTAGPIQDALRSEDDVSLAVAIARGDAEVQLLVGAVGLDGLSLQEAAELVPPRCTWGGPAKDAPAAEIAQISPALAELSRSRKAQGSCSLQQLLPGDRIVSVNGALDVRAFLGATSPTLLVARWRPADLVQTERFQVAIERTGPEDRLGMHIRPRPGSATGQVEVLSIVPGGAIARWNSSPGAQQVIKGDRIVSVNGHDKDLEKKLASTKATITFERWVDHGMGGADPVGGPSIPAPAPPASTASAAKPAPPSSTQDRAAPSVCFLLRRAVVVAMLVAAVCFGDQSMLKHAAEAVQVLELCAALARSALLKAPRKDQAALPLLLAGGLLSLHFLWYEVRMLAQPLQRGLLRQLLVAVCASALLGCGGFSLLAWAGVEA